MTDAVAPLTPPGCDLRDFPHTPLFRARLFGSSFNARATDSEWRAGVTLWLKSWDQMPAGSLPDDDIELCRLAELARDLKGWGKLKTGALRGWIRCSDGRLYHPVVAEGVNNAIDKKSAQRAKTAKARLAMLEKRLMEAKTDAERSHITEEVRKLKQSLSQTESLYVTDIDTDYVTNSKGRRREGEGKGEGIKEEKSTRKRAPPSRPDDVTEQVWGDWLQLRKTKRADVTETVIAQARTESEKAGIPLDGFLAVWCARGSQGLMADWLKPNERISTIKPAESFAERDARIGRENWERMTGRQWPADELPGAARPTGAMVIEMEKQQPRRLSE